MDLLQTMRQLDIGEEDMPGALEALAIQTYEKFHKSGDISAIDIAIEAAQLRLTVILDTSSPRIGHLNNFGVFLESRYERTGDMADLEEAIRMQTGGQKDDTNQGGVAVNMRYHWVTVFDRDTVAANSKFHWLEAKMDLTTFDSLRAVLQRQNRTLPAISIFQRA
ncbi:hypothetical protein CDV31_014880 [Fusarium ambrosium]|uniref:Uncharacterized protein n=1 Tax=Fusarium ambrosium TaxID=131363 RepID=A0A428STD0_9HYPO|nr:hypothetical protein CDV31_014880 [Fusarium ambrosium]